MRYSVHDEVICSPSPLNFFAFSHDLYVLGLLFDTLFTPIDPPPFLFPIDQPNPTHPFYFHDVLCMLSYREQNDDDEDRNRYHLRGVNLGSWMVLEPWITPSMFFQFLGKVRCDGGAGADAGSGCMGRDMCGRAQILDSFGLCRYVQ